MADISQVKLPNGDTYNLVDETSGYIKNYTETDPVFSASAAAGITSTDISNWNAKPSTDTNTTYALSGALSSHKFTSTLTAGGSGSGTSTSDFTLVAGTGITITDDTSNRKMTIACNVTNTDENVKSTAGGASTDAFYLTGSSSSSTATGTLVKHAEIYAGHNSSGAYIAIGDSSNNYRGWINLYSSGASYCATLQPADNFTANRIITLPNKTGTIALTSDIPSVYSSTNTGGYLTMATLPIYDGTVE